MSTVRREAFGGDERPRIGAQPRGRYTGWMFRAQAMVHHHGLAGDDRQRAMARSWGRFDARCNRELDESRVVLGGGFETPPQE